MAVLARRYGEIMKDRLKVEPTHNLENHFRPHSTLQNKKYKNANCLLGVVACLTKKTD